MARPSKNQIAARKAAKSLERRDANLRRQLVDACFVALCDFAVVVCENCGLEQTNPTADNDDAALALDVWYVQPCVVCGHDIARTGPSNSSVIASAQAMASA